mmetsp:Transcript_7979/g.26279  ORF Transcript_7979/g.26279 Transcript_7979/m.26279 type:complete len:233 (+) Transcript_7979:251-949(+)
MLYRCASCGYVHSRPSSRPYLSLAIVARRGSRARCVLRNVDANSSACSSRSAPDAPPARLAGRRRATRSARVGTRALPIVVKAAASEARSRCRAAYSEQRVGAGSTHTVRTAGSSRVGVLSGASRGARPSLLAPSARLPPPPATRWGGSAASSERVAEFARPVRAASTRPCDHESSSASCVTDGDAPELSTASRYRALRICCMSCCSACGSLTSRPLSRTARKTKARMCQTA